MSKERNFAHEECEAMPKERDFLQELQNKYYQELSPYIRKNFDNYQLPIQIIKLYRSPENGRWNSDIEFSRKPISEIYKLYKAKVIELPFYQRGKSWPIEKRGELLYTILLGLPIPPILLFEFYESNSYKYILLDGWQRLSTIIDFIEGGIKIKLDNNIEHINPYIASKDEILKTLFERLNYKSTPLSTARIVLLTALSLGEQSENMSKEKILLILKFYKRYNLENSREIALMFFIRSLVASFYTHLKLENKDDLLNQILRGKRHKSFSLVLTSLFRYLISYYSFEDFKKIFNLVISVASIVFKGDILMLRRNTSLGLSEVIGITVALKLNNPQLFDTNEELNKFIEELYSKEKEYLQAINKETITRNAKVYIGILEKLIATIDKKFKMRF